MKHIFFTMCWIILITAPAYASNPLPRFASLRSDEVNMRAGPGTRYPIRWVYHRISMPVEIVDEYGNWRQIRDIDGAVGWIHHSLLSGRRTALVHDQAHMLRRNPDRASPPVLKAKPMVIGNLIRCSREWCYLSISGYKGWMQKTSLWGVYEDEVF